MKRGKDKDARAKAKTSSIVGLTLETARNLPEADRARIEAELAKIAPPAPGGG